MAQDGPVYIGLRSRTPFDARLRCLKGSDWFTASSRAVARLVRALALGNDEADAEGEDAEGE